MPPFDDQAHRRFNPLTRLWTLVASGRTGRPWSGKLDPASGDERPSYDPDCHLCPRHTRVGEMVNPDYEGTFVSTNDFASLRPETPLLVDGPHTSCRTETEQGTCRVICSSPRPDLTLSLISRLEIRRTIDLWADQAGDMSGTYRGEGRRDITPAEAVRRVQSPSTVHYSRRNL